MSYTYTTGTNIAKIRDLIGDNGGSSVAVLTDEEINTFLSLTSNNLYLTAAVALVRIAASRSLLAKKKSAGNYSEDLRSIAKECRETAAMYREMAADEGNAPSDAQIEQYLTSFNEDEINRNKALRDEDV